MTLLCFQPAATAAASPTNETDRVALLKFKEMIPNDPFNIFTSWNDSIHLCNWQGVTCGRKHQRVTGLELSGYTLGGSISPYIGNLSFLSFVNFSGNFLHGEIPQQLTHLFRLKRLNLSSNLLAGEIPSNFTNCPQLRFLDFKMNNLTGNIPVELGSLKRLVFLGVSTNHLTGGIPPSLGNVSSLQALDFSLNYFVGNIPDEMGHLQRLVYFGVVENDMFGTFPYSFFNISTLKSIEVGGNNRLNGTLPANIGLTLSNLRNLNIGYDEFSGPIPVSLSNASQLEFLYLSANNFVGQVPTDLGNLQNLFVLAIGGNNLGINSAKDLDFLTSLENCTKLEALDFSLNNFGGSLPDSIGNLSKQLSGLYVGGNQISGIIPATLENLINLRIFGMEENLFTGTIPTYFGKLQKLQGLFFSGNRLLGDIPSSLGNLTRLVDLNLYQNKLEGSIPSSFGNCKSLQLLNISKNNLSGAIPETSLSTQLLRLDLSHNSLTGILPMEVGNLKNIYYFDVSENNFLGEIPETIGNCLSLQNLYLQGNSFEGNLPPSLASLKDLHYANLSRNNFSGIIPKDLQKVSVLLYLNLSFNNLVGEVPTEGVFRNTSGISVIGNKKLCGGIRELKLQACHVEVMKEEKSHVFKLTAIIVSGVLCFILFSSFLVLYRRRKSKKESSSTLPKTNFLSNVSYKELYQTTDGFSPTNLIGSGSFSSVYKGIIGQEKKMVAVKVLNLQQKGASKSFIAECNALRNIRHRNLVKILTCCSSVDYNGNEFKALVYEFMANGNLDKWLHHDRDSGSPPSYLNLLQRLNIAIDVASALNYLHDHCEIPIIHCDLKPSNVLLDDDMIAKISDFGLARILSTTNDVSQNQTSTVGIKGTIEADF
ncbi:putative receptor-like protein kinase At3g47110 [Corylus avellana]|uniref:putative receptor-like protein kinase At3g47110 n=1 Tax=Corylus avellana TaxID=13451 RepID=UPI00286A60AC|nr:putative receptor-like protein kinase At3g47110 [Corylus avellana]